MTKYYNIELDGIDGFVYWDYYPVCPETGYTEKGMFDDVREGLKELGGGHADIWIADTDEFYAEVEV